MTSLGSVCREKITAAANQLSVDTEIVKVENIKNHQVVSGSERLGAACLHVSGIQGKQLVGSSVRTKQIMKT